MSASREKSADWVKSLSARQKILIGIVVAVVAIAILYQIPGSGFGKDENKSETTKKIITPKTGEIIDYKETTTHYQSAKTLWDWLQLGGVIAIPFALFYFERREQRRSEQRDQQEKEQAEEQTKREKEIADNSLREQALEAYVDRMSELLIDKNLKVLIGKELKESDPEYSVLDAALDIARARTLSVVRRLAQDRERINSVFEFLSDAELINKPILRGANLSRADLSGVDLSLANLEGAKLTSANLKGAKLGLSFDDVSMLHFTAHGLVMDANLRSANLRSANLSRADLRSANLINVNLSGADLSGADLTGANLNGANLRGADLNGADLRGADLNGADLSNAKNLTPDQVKFAKNWDKAEYSEEFYPQLGLSPKPAKNQGE